MPEKSWIKNVPNLTEFDELAYSTASWTQNDIALVVKDQLMEVQYLD